MCSYTHTNTHVQCSYTHMCTHMCTRSSTHMNTCAHAPIHRYAHTHTNKYIQHIHSLVTLAECFLPYEVTFTVSQVSYKDFWAVVAHAFNLSTQETEADRSFWVQPNLQSKFQDSQSYRETLSLKRNLKKKRRKKLLLGTIFTHPVPTWDQYHQN